MALNNYNLNKLLSRSKQVINQVKKAKLDLSYQPESNQQSEKKPLPKLERPRKNPIFKLSSSKGFTNNHAKELRINTLPDYIDDGVIFGPDYQTPKFSTGFTVNVTSDQKLLDMFSTFGFNKKPKPMERTEKSIKSRGKENKEHSEHRSNREEVKERDEKEFKQSKKKFLSTLNFGAKKEKNKINISSRRFI